MIKVTQPFGDRQCDPSLKACSPIDSLTLVQLIPNVLKRILSYAHPAENVNCLPVQWHIKSVAFSQIHASLTKPKNGMLLLRWPRCFHNREDARHSARQFRFVGLIRYNITRRMASEDENLVIQQVQTFLAGYEALMLNRVLANVQLYSNLTAFMVDFSANNDGKARRQFECSECHDEQSLPFKTQNRSPVVPAGTGRASNHSRLSESFDTLYMNSELWIKTITTVAKESAGSLLHLILIDRVCSGGNSTGCATLPRQFYHSLSIESMLAGMRNLQTLYLPSVKLYETSGGERGSVPVKLPSLKRVFLVWPEGLWDDPTRSMSSRLPAFSTASDVIVECLTSNSDTFDNAHSKCPLFPSATVTGPVAHCLDIPRVLLEISEDFLLNYSESSDIKMKSFLGDKVRYFLDVLAPQRYEIVNATKNDSKANRDDSTRSYIRFRVTPFDSDQSAKNALHVVLSVLRQRQSQCRACLSIVVGSNFEGRSASNWFVCHEILQVLPFFVANDERGSAYNRFEGDGIHIRVETSGSSFSSIFRSWKYQANYGNDAKSSEYEQLLSKQFKLPKIYLHASPTIRITLDDQRGREFPYDTKAAKLSSEEKLAEKIETLVMNGVMSFVRDAVECCRSKRSRDVCFYMYQSLKSCTFTCKVKTKESKWPKIGMEMINRVLRSRAALFERRVLQAIFKELLPAGVDVDVRPWLYKDTPKLINALGSIARNLTIYCEEQNSAIR